jgi:hypothetical protein
MASADIIIFKDGGRLQTSRAWVENDQVKCDFAGIVISYPKKDIKRIERGNQTRRQEKQKTESLTKSPFLTDSQILNKKQETILRMQKLYVQLMGFSNNPTFHKIGFAKGYFFRHWQNEVHKLQDETDRKVMQEVLKDTQVGTLTLLLLGQEYFLSKGKETEYSKYQNERLKRLFKITNTPNQ